MEKNELYPIFIKLELKNLLLVGGGNVALEKLQSLLTNSPKANITIVAPEIKEEILHFISGYDNCKIVKRGFVEADLAEQDLVICATDNPDLHKKIKQWANAKGIMVNVADTPDLCDFYLSSIVQKGNLKIAVSTNGKSPTIAKRVKELLNDTIPDDIDQLLHKMQMIRDRIGGDFAQKVIELNKLTEELLKK